MALSLFQIADTPPFHERLFQKRWHIARCPLESIVLEFYHMINKKTEIRRPFTIEDQVTITPPENFRVGTIPQEMAMENEFGKFSIRYEQGENNSLTIFRNAVFQKGNYAGDTFDKFYDMLRKIKSAEQSKVVLQSKT